MNDVGEVLRRVALGDIALPGSLKAGVPRDARSDLPQGDVGASRGSIPFGPWSWRPTSRAGWRTKPSQGVREPLGRGLAAWERRHRTFLRISGIALVAVALVAIAGGPGRQCRPRACRRCAAARPSS